MTATVPTSLQTITLGGGCFWCTEAVFVQVRGVLDVESGYSDGHVQRPSYEDVCTGTTGHNEVVKLVFDPALISLREVLEVFFVIHDPTTLNRQGNDFGTQYRSAIYCHSPQQYAEAQALLDEFAVANVFGAPVVTQLAMAGRFFPAEDYHRRYYLNNERQPYCQFVVAPKLAKFRKMYAAKRKPT